ncbi:hypothetical protein C2845_PM06G26980 [Panicum miliaceum]|uniref:Uncharacterized protein n=1 Tax=Panicum miliaceum TaxID=4540 RepID=A0A3L6R9L6_PANMI|nr:hypothetical protein C2845_PM06G26980 [Panicum miliaceum]
MLPPTTTGVTRGAPARDLLVVATALILSSLIFVGRALHADVSRSRIWGFMSARKSAVKGCTTGPYILEDSQVAK